MSTQRLADLRTEFDTAQQLVSDLFARRKARWAESEKCGKRYSSLHNEQLTVAGFKAAHDEDAVNLQLVAEAVEAARAARDAAEQAAESACADYSRALSRQNALRATLRAAEYLDERETQR